MLSHSDLIINVLDVIRFRRGVVSYSTKKRPFHVLSRRIHGNSEIYKDKQTYYADENKVLYIPSGTDYSQKSGCEEEIIAVHFEILNFGTDRACCRTGWRSGSACCRIQMLSGKIEQYGGNDNACTKTD